MACKPNSDDIRDAPEAMANAKKAYPQLTYADTFSQCLKGADVVVLLTEWDQFRSADPEMMGELVAGKATVDGRHALDADAYRAAGRVYRALGRPADPKTVRLSVDAKDQVTVLFSTSMAGRPMRHSTAVGRFWRPRRTAGYGRGQ